MEMLVISKYRQTDRKADKISNNQRIQGTAERSWKMGFITSAGNTLLCLSLVTLNSSVEISKRKINNRNT